MIVGDPASLAIESSISKAYLRPSFLALGFFVIHVGGRCYGVRSADATMLACSFDEVNKRLTERGRHHAPFAGEAAAREIADAFRHAFYAPDQEDAEFFGFSYHDFGVLIHSNGIVWAPDGDEAFDDGSYVLQFDVGDRVRVIAFRSSESGSYEPGMLKDVWLKGDDYYGILQKWTDGFEDEWRNAKKVPEDPDK